jgi:hypothetical protein
MKEGTLVYHPEWGKGLVIEALLQSRRMKVGTLIEHRRWGKAFVTEVLGDRPFNPIRVTWLKTHTSPSGYKVTTSVIWQQEITIISEGE